MNSKKNMFKVALAVAGISQREFARQHKCKASIIIRILSQKSHSKRLEPRIDQFIEAELSKLNSWSLNIKKAGIKANLKIQKQPTNQTL